VSTSRILGALSVLIAGCLLNGHAEAALKKHHLTLALGYEKLVSDEMKNNVTGIDFSSSGYGAFAYRFSLKQNFDLTVDFRGVTHSDDLGGVDFTLTNTYWGPGLRFIAPNEGMRPYVQTNFLFVREELEAEQNGITVTAHDGDAGFGICGGVDIRAGNLLSVPIEVNYMYGKPNDDISGIGVNAGLTFNFGDLK